MLFPPVELWHQLTPGIDSISRVPESARAVILHHQLDHCSHPFMLEGQNLASKVEFFDKIDAMLYHIRPGSFDNTPSPFGMDITIRMGHRGGHECHSNSFQSVASVVGRTAGDDDRRASKRRHVLVTRAAMGGLSIGLTSVLVWPCPC